MHTKSSSLLIATFCSAISFNSYAVIDNNAQIVQLRTSCTEAGASLNNCFTNLNTLDSWVQTTRLPTITSPLAINVGPGEFPGIFNCNSNQHISLNGSGRNSSTLKRSGTPGIGFFSTVVLGGNCNLHVNNLRIDNIGGAAAVNVLDTVGSDLNMHTVWNNVEIISTGYTWLEEHCAPNNPVNNSIHFWAASKLTSVGGGFANFTKTYVSCAENWFHATEITADMQTTTGGDQAQALLAFGETHVYGGVIRVIDSAGNTYSSPAPHPGAAGPRGIVAIYASGQNADVHVHGAGIDVFSTAPNDIAGIMTENNAHVHVMNSTFNMKSCDNTAACGGELQRIVNLSGNVRSVFQWESGDTPPKLSSQDGMDTFVETDCSASDCSTTGNEPHMLIYSDQCSTAGSTADPWFDIVTSQCKGGGNP